MGAHYYTSPLSFAERDASVAQAFSQGAEAGRRDVLAEIAEILSPFEAHGPLTRCFFCWEMGKPADVYAEPSRFTHKPRCLWFRANSLSPKE